MRGEPKLTKAMRLALTEAERNGGQYYPAQGARACSALVRHGMMVKFVGFGPYRITPAGRRALEAHPHPSRESSNG